MTERPNEENLMKVIKNYSPSFGNSGFTRLKENFIIFLSIYNNKKIYIVEHKKSLCVLKIKFSYSIEYLKNINYWVTR